jgi:hypothetical protein
METGPADGKPAGVIVVPTGLQPEMEDPMTGLFVVTNFKLRGRSSINSKSGDVPSGKIAVNL